VKTVGIPLMECSPLAPKGYWEGPEKTIAAWSRKLNGQEELSAPRKFDVRGRPAAMQGDSVPVKVTYWILIPSKENSGEKQGIQVEKGKLLTFILCLGRRKTKQRELEKKAKF